MYGVAARLFPERGVCLAVFDSCVSSTIQMAFRERQWPRGPGQSKLRPHYRLILYDLIGIRSIDKMYMDQ